MTRSSTQFIAPLQAINEKSTETEEDLRKKAKTSKFIFGKKDQKVEVEMSVEDDPLKMLNGMEEFLYKNATFINFGKEQTVPWKIHSAVLGPKDAILAKIFSFNVDKTIEKYRQETGIDLKALAALDKKVEQAEKPL